jgi:putative intracellular protease/amidase
MKAVNWKLIAPAEEQVAGGGDLGGRVRFYPDDALKAAGGKVEIAKPWASQVVRDRELITGQNPNSDGQLAEELVKVLDAKGKGN